MSPSPVTDGRAQPVFCLCRRDVLPHLASYLASGERRMAGWYATLKVAEVAFDDEAEAFANINSREDLGRLEDVGCAHLTPHARHPHSA